MKIQLSHLRELGKRLREVFLKIRHTSRASESLGRGASGDRTLGIDRVAEETILEFLDALQIGLTIISEEKGMLELHGGGELVIIDPVDGSKNAATGFPIFATSIAIAAGDTLNTLRLSYIINPLAYDEFWAEAEKGAFLNGSRITTDPDDKIKVVLYETQKPERDIQRAYPVLKLANRTRCLGTTALDLALLSMGAASVYINPVPTRCFDYAAGILLVREAGGVITDVTGRDFFLNRISMSRTPPLLVSANEKVHNRVIKEIEEEAKGWMN